MSALDIGMDVIVRIRWTVPDQYQHEAEATVRNTILDLLLNEASTRKFLATYGLAVQSVYPLTGSMTCRKNPKHTSNERTPS